MNFITDSTLDMAASFMDSVSDKLLLYGINITNSTAVLGQQAGDDYHTIITVDSAMTSSNSSIVPCAGITRVENGLKFKLPNFFREMFTVASFQYEGTDSAVYLRAMLNYGSHGSSSKELARVNNGYYSYRNNNCIVASYGGLAPSSDDYEIYLNFLSYKAQQLFGANIIIGVLV